MTELENYIHTFFGVQQNDVSQIVTFFKPVQLKKGDYFLKTGMSANKLAFVQSGMLREFVEIEGKEITKWITSKGYFVVDLGSFVFGQSARWNIQALTDCELYIIDFVDYQNIALTTPLLPGEPALDIGDFKQCAVTLKKPSPAPQTVGSAKTDFSARAGWAPARANQRCQAGWQGQRCSAGPKNPPTRNPPNQRW